MAVRGGERARAGRKGGKMEDKGERGNGGKERDTFSYGTDYEWENQHDEVFDVDLAEMDRWL